MREKQVTIPEHIKQGKQIRGEFDPEGNPIFEEVIVPEETHTRVQSGDRDLTSAIDRRVKYLEEDFPEGASIEELAERRRQVQGVVDRGKGFEKGGAGQADPAISVGAAKIEEGAIGDVLKTAATMDPDVAQYLEATGAHHRVAGMLDPVTSATTKGRSAAARGGSSFEEALSGRALAPYLGAASAGGAGFFAAGPGGLAAAPLGALAAVKVGDFFRSAAWNTLAARTKFKLLPILESEGFAAFQDATARAVVLENTRRRQAQEVLEKQGEGVIE
jgi:hypothetical protein